MRINHSSIRTKEGQGSALEHYIGNMSEAFVRSRAQADIKRAREMAEEAIRSRSSFLENMNHELRTPLNAIIGFTTMMKDANQYELPEDKRQDYLDYILQSADLLLGHINTILEIAALDNGSIQPVKEAIRTDELIRNSIKRVKIRANAAEVKILSGLAKGDDEGTLEIPSVWADSERLAQAFDHLLQTAIKSCKSGGKVLVRTSYRREGWAEIQFRDDGEGFSPEQLAEALEAFDDKSFHLNRPFNGVAIGISIAKTFIEMQGGEFKIKSIQGKGTLSTVSLPLTEVSTQTGNKAVSSRSSAIEPNTQEKLEKTG